MTPEEKLMAIRDAVDELYKLQEKQGNQKPADKVETKQNPDIEKGKWYVCNTARYTDFVVGKAYYCPKNGMLKPDENEMARYVARNCFRLWTIQDAKDGDVLVAEIDEEPNDFIYIFKEYNQNLGFWSHCYLDAYTNKFHEGIYHNNLNVGVPATKEQRDMFFQKMHEAGYEWDFEVKELNKIEKKPACSEEEKQLLLKDLCARLPYHVRVKVWLKDGSTEEGPLDLQHNYGDVLLDAFYYNKITKIRPYLRPMSSMTKEETLHIQTLVQNKNHELYSRIEECGATGTPDWKLYEISYIRTGEEMDYLNSRHLDWRGLIPKKLALEVPEGMYNTKTE